MAFWQKLPNLQRYCPSLQPRLSRLAKWRIRDGQRARACKLPGLSTFEDGPLHRSCGILMLKNSAKPMAKLDEKMVIRYWLGVKGQTKDWNPNRFVFVTEFWWHFLSLIGLIKMCTAFWTNSYTPNLGLRQKQPIQCFEIRLHVPRRYWPRLPIKPLDFDGNITGIIGIATPMIWQIGNSHSHVESWCGFVWKC